MVLVGTLFVSALHGASLGAQNLAGACLCFDGSKRIGGGIMAVESSKTMFFTLCPPPGWQECCKVELLPIGEQQALGKT